MLTLVIDPGHGGQSTLGGSSPNNAMGPTGTLEKNVTLAIAMAMKAQAPPSIHLALTRDQDVNLGLADRAAMAEHLHADIFLSIHLNGWPTQSVQGTETYHHRDSNRQSQDLAERVQSNIIGVTRLRDRGVKTGGFGVLKPHRHNSKTAACLVEVSFLTVAAEEARLLDANYINEISSGLLRACAQYLSRHYDDILSLVDPVPVLDNVPPLGVATAHPGVPGKRLQSRVEFEIEDASSLRQADLTGINGIGPARNDELAAFGISNIGTLSGLSHADIDACSEAINLPTETIAGWVSEAKTLKIKT